MAPLLPYSRLKLAKPGQPGVAGHRPGATVASPVAAGVRLQAAPRRAAPPLASEPYCAAAAAPSRSTSTCRSAIDGMLEMSGPCDPSATPLPIQVMTAPRWRRFPFTSTSVWSGAESAQGGGADQPRPPSPTGCGLML